MCLVDSCSSCGDNYWASMFLHTYYHTTNLQLIFLQYLYIQLLLVSQLNKSNKVMSRKRLDKVINITRIHKASIINLLSKVYNHHMEYIIIVTSCVVQVLAKIPDQVQKVVGYERGGYYHPMNKPTLSTSDAKKVL